MASDHAANPSHYAFVITAEGAIWKEHGGKETYAPSGEGDFGIVPKGYEMGMIPVNARKNAALNPKAVYRDPMTGHVKTATAAKASRSSGQARVGASRMRRRARASSGVSTARIIHR